jgi:signal transduction histidine kinase
VDGIRKLLKLYNYDTKPSIEEKEAPPATFYGELNRWCNSIAVPISILAIFAWPIYIPIDVELFPNVGTLIKVFRWGLTLTGLITLVLHFTPFFKKRGYWLNITIITYLTITTGIILGLVAGHPAYMGGFSIVILGIALQPLKRMHALGLTLFSLIIFKILGSIHNMQFVTPAQSYGLYNLVVSVAVALVTIYVFDLIRLNSYRNSMAQWMASEELNKANQLKNQLFQIAAHDLKDPLQVIIGYTDMLKMRLGNDRSISEKLKIMHRSTERMIKLIAGLMEITNLESGKLKLHKSHINLGKIVNTAVKSHEKESQQKNQKLLYSTEQSCILDGDQMMLRQVANQLINNAIKFSPPGATIWVTVERLETGESATLKVQDEGPGLTKEDIQRVFSKFQDLSTKATGGEASTGLGLAIAHDLVSLHEGTISVESEPEKGCTFIVTLPLIPPSDMEDEDDLD